MLSSQVHTIQHSSKLLSYIHPYILTYNDDNLAVHFWTCTKDSAPTYNGTLERQITEPLEIHLISPKRLLIRSDSYPDSIYLNELMIYELPVGNLLDTLSLGDVSSFEEGAKGLLGFSDDKVAIWRNAGAQDGDVIDLYNVNEDGRFAHLTTLKAGSSLPRTYSIRIQGYLSDKPVYIKSDQVLGFSTGSKLPCTMYLTRWSTRTDERSRKIYDFGYPPSYQEGEEWYTQLGSHVHIRSIDSCVIAFHPVLLDFIDLNPSTTLLSINTKSTDVNWRTSLPQITQSLKHLPAYDAILAIGDSVQHRSSTSIVILDPHSGSMKQEHILPAPENDCGGIFTSGTGAVVGVTLSQQALIVIFGDGQSATIPMEEFMTDGFKSFVNEEGRLRTVPFTDTHFGVPKNYKQRKKMQKGSWCWIFQALIGDEQVVLDTNDRKGFVVVSFQSSTQATVTRSLSRFLAEATLNDAGILDKTSPYKVEEASTGSVVI